LSSRRGFTVIEALIAIVTLIMVMMVVVGTVPKVYQGASHDGVRMEAATAAQQYLDTLHQYVQANGTNTNLPAAPTVAIDAGDAYAPNASPAPMSTPGNFTMTNNGCPFVAGSSRMYDCLVTATWTQSGQDYTLNVESYVTSEN
jgi:Tfp pilus assembly protein PilE